MDSTFPDLQLTAGSSLCMRRRKVLAAAAVILLFACLAPQSARGADDVDDLEERVKAAFLYKFAGYVDWPSAKFPTPDTPVTLAVMGADPVASELLQIVTGRTVQGRSLTVKRLNPGDPTIGVHILFVGSGVAERLGQIARAAELTSILVVTDAEGARAQGSVVNFVMTERRLRFDVSLDTAEKNGLKLSSRLLAVAREVRTGGH